MELQRTTSRVRGIGLDVELVSPQEAMRLMPAISGRSLFGAVWIPDDGHLDPHTATHALAGAARSLGAQILTDIRVTGIERSDRGKLPEQAAKAMRDANATFFAVNTFQPSAELEGRKNSLPPGMGFFQFGSGSIDFINPLANSEQNRRRIRSRTC